MIIFVAVLYALYVHTPAGNPLTVTLKTGVPSVLAAVYTILFIELLTKYKLFVLELPELNVSCCLLTVILPVIVKGLQPYVVVMLYV